MVRVYELVERPLYSYIPAKYKEDEIFLRLLQDGACMRARVACVHIWLACFLFQKSNKLTYNPCSDAV